MRMRSLMVPDAVWTARLPAFDDEIRSDVSLDATDTTGSPTDSAPETAVGNAGVTAREPSQSNKKRRATYYVRRDAITSLKGQVKALEQELARARSTSAATLRKLRRLSLLYEQSIESNYLTVAGTESTLSVYKLKLLESLWRPKLDATLRFMTERVRFLDLRNEHKSEESFKLRSGDMVFVGCEVTTFTGGHTVNQVFRALGSFIVSQEISISERLGVLTIRESDDADGIKYGHSRFLSSTSLGVNVESSSAMFAAYVEANAAESKPAYAVAAMDFVDVDDLYPYRPDTRARKEMTAALTITETTSDNGARVVSLSKWAYIRLRMPLCGLSEDEAASLRDSVTGFSAVMDKVMREHLATELPLP